MMNVNTRQRGKDEYRIQGDRRQEVGVRRTAREYKAKRQ